MQLLVYAEANKQFHSNIIFVCFILFQNLILTMHVYRVGTKSGYMVTDRQITKNQGSTIFLFLLTDHTWSLLKYVIPKSLKRRAQWCSQGVVK